MRVLRQALHAPAKHASPGQTLVFLLNMHIRVLHRNMQNAYHCDFIFVSAMPYRIPAGISSVITGLLLSDILHGKADSAHLVLAEADYGNHITECQDILNMAANTCHRIRDCN